MVQSELLDQVASLLTKIVKEKKVRSTLMCLDMISEGDERGIHT
jgi:hypothetical protein